MVTGPVSLALATAMAGALLVVGVVDVTGWPPEFVPVSASATTVAATTTTAPPSAHHRLVRRFLDRGAPHPGGGSVTANCAVSRVPGALAYRR